MDKVLKQRLIGASILIALAVIFVPMLFDGPQEASESRELNIELPNAPGDRAPVRRLPLDPEQSRAQAQADQVESTRGADERIEPSRIESTPIESPPSRDELMAEIESQVDESEAQAVAESTLQARADEPESAPDPAVARADTEPPVEPEPEAAAPARASVPDDSNEGEGFEVQVASFGSLQNAEDLVARLTRLGHVATVDRLVRGPSELHRVRTGPYRRRADAERALAQIQQTVSGVQPVIVGSATTVLPDRSADSGFAVQVGSFASRNNAVRLLDQLAGQGYDAFVHQDTAGSRTIWRVRVGPLGSREAAVQRLARMTENDGIDGLVVSHP